MTDKYAMYLRKSRADIELEAIDKLDTLKRHHAILTELARRNHYYIEEVYKEVVSGETIDARPEMQRLLQDIKANKYKGVLVVEVERLARGDTKDQGIVAEAFKFTNTLIVTPAKTYDPNNQFDEEYFEFGLFMSRREYKTIQRRLTAGKLQSIKEGNYLQSYRPYGWDTVRKGKIRTLTPREDEAKIVKLMFDWKVNEKITTGAIARRLTDMGILTYTGQKEWNRSSVKDIIKNPVHAGKIRWQSRKTERVFGEDGKMHKTRPRTNPDEIILVEGKHDGIIPFEMWQEAQKDFKADKTKHRTNLTNPFATILVCAKCGKTFVYQANKGIMNANAKPRLMHRESKYCKVKSIFYSEFEAAFIQALQAHVTDFETKLDNSNEFENIQRHEEQMALIEKELEKFATQKKKLFDYLEREIYTEEEFIERKTLLDENKKTAEKQLKKLKATQPQPVNYEEKIVKLSEAINTLKDKDVNAKIKNKLLKEIVEKIEFGRENNDSFTIDIHLL